MMLQHIIHKASVTPRSIFFDRNEHEKNINILVH